jgi:outer membrane protein OmpA-like peptidoglycan-associated protein
VRIGITYTPGLRPGMLVLGSTYGDRLDSMRAVIGRDLEFTDRFEMISLPGGDSLLLGLTLLSGAGEDTSSTAIPFVNYSLYAALGADWAVSVTPEADSTRLRVTLYDVRGETPRQAVRGDLRGLDDPDFRMSAHRIADELVRAATGEPGFAATRLLFIQHGRLYRVDADGAELEVVSSLGITAFSPDWLPDARRVAYSELSEGWGRIVIHDLETGDRRPVGPTGELLNYAAAVSPDGGLLAFARSSCLERLTVGRFSDNLSPTFSPDGRQIAYVSTRPGLPQIYVMAADGTGQELFAPFDYGVTGSSNAPEWSPDGTRLAFHRDDVGARWTSPRVHLEPDGAASGVGDRHRNRQSAAVDDRRGCAIAGLVASDTRDYDTIRNGVTMRLSLPIALTFGAAVMVAAACGGGQPEPVVPAVDSAALRDSIRRADSLAAVEAARRDSLERARMEEQRIRREREEMARRERAITAEVRAMLQNVINFDFDKSNIRAGTDTEMLEQKLAVLQANPNVMVEITGHCDERGSDEYNMALGMRRALSAKKWLTDRGIADSRVTVRSMGEEMPVDPGHNENAWAQNRRDAFGITAGGEMLVKPAGM